MRIRVIATLMLFVLATLTLSLIRGQERPQVSAQPQPAPEQPPPLRDASLNDGQKQVLLSARRGADWLSRSQDIKGRFLVGLVPALKIRLTEGDHFPSQVAAALALARTARITSEPRYAASATQALLALLEDTVADESDVSARHTAMPGNFLNRLGSAGLLLMAINELPAPQKDLLEKSEQLCNYIRKQVREDGSLAYQGGDAKEQTNGINEHPGAALCGLAVSLRHRPEAWKTEVLLKALPFYRAWWKKNSTSAFVPQMTAAYAETYTHTKHKDCFAFVCEMNDWLCTLQYPLDPHRVSWHGGFKNSLDGRSAATMPTCASAAAARSLAAACRAVADAGDLARFKSYTAALENALRFLMTLQYTTEDTNHFADWYRPQVVGGFHHSEQDGNLKIDDTAGAVVAMLGYLEYTASRAME